MRSLKVEIKDTTGKLVADTYVYLPDADDDCDTLVLAASRSDSSIIRHQLGTVHIGEKGETE